LGLEIETKVSKKNTIYIPKSIAEAVGLREGMRVKLKVEKGRIIIELIPGPFTLALISPKFAKTTVEEFEEESEEMQHEIFEAKNTS